MKKQKEQPKGFSVEEVRQWLFGKTGLVTVTSRRMTVKNQNCTEYREHRKERK